VSNPTLEIPDTRLLNDGIDPAETEYERATRNSHAVLFPELGSGIGFEVGAPTGTHRCLVAALIPHSMRMYTILYIMKYVSGVWSFL
jgi:hypothetical protein